jgi:aspartate kinase
VAAEVDGGREVAVVVSAMAGRTNELVAWTDGAGAAAPGMPSSDDEYDVVVASGEQVSAGLLAMTMRNMGYPARSWLAWQIPIVTDSSHGRARIQEVAPEKLLLAMTKGEIPIIAGFQGVDAEGRVSTLGRGAGDLSAVAVAAALRPAACNIYTDVDGVYTTDPRIEQRARRLERVSYEEMLEMASLGARVLQSRSVELAMAQRVPLRVLSSMVEPGQGDQQGTVVCDEEEIMEKRIVSGVAYSRDEAKITLFGLPDHPGVSSQIFSRLADANVNVDMIVQSRARTGDTANMEFTVGKRDAARAVEIVLGAKSEIGFEDIAVNEDVAKVSVIGVGMRSHAGVAKTMFSALGEKGVNIQVISTSEIKISVLIDAAYTELAVRALHAAYELDKV